MTRTPVILARAELSDVERAQARRLTEICDDHDGLLLKVTTDLPPARSATERNAFLCYRDRTLVGYCALDGGDDREQEICGMVDPAYRRRGIGRALLAAAREEGVQRGLQRLLLICEDASASGRAYVAAAGTLIAFSEYHMVLGRLVVAPARHPGLKVERGRPEDVEAIAHITARAFGDPEELVLARTAQDLPDPSQRYYVSWLDGRPVASLKVYPYEHDGAGIYAFGVLPERAGQGIGRQTLTEVCRRLLAEGRTHISLEVETTNAIAHALYRSCGFAERTTYGYYALDLDPQASTP